MLETTRNDYKNLPKEKLLSKYTAYSLLGIVVILLCCQLIAQLFTTNQLHKITGVLVKNETGPAYYTRGRGREFNKTYAYLITLNNGITYTVNLEPGTFYLSETIKPGGNVTIYTPTWLYNVLSLAVITRRDCVSQFEYNNDILYSFDHQQRKDTSFIWFLAAAALLFSYGIYRLEIYNV